MTANFFNLLRRPEAIPPTELVESLAAAYPFFWLPSALLLIRAKDTLDKDYAALLRSRVSLNCSDPTFLFRKTDDSGDAISNLYPNKPNTTPDTANAIDIFLKRYGSHDPAEEKVLERLIFNPVPSDYSSTLSEITTDDTTDLPDQKEAIGDDDDSLESILNAVRSIQSLSPSASETDHEKSDTAHQSPNRSRTRLHVPPAPADSTFSESLAKIYIRQQRFDKALEIISALSLKFPEKSVYFADQIRFLRKLILNRTYNSQQ